MAQRRRVGVVGYGQLGKTDAAVASDSNVPPHCHLKNLENFADMGADLIVEVAHPSITQEYGHIFLEKADYMIGSPTALADQGTEARILGAANSIEWKTGLYIPTGALWGARDIQSMADRGRLRGLTVTMKKHPSAFKVFGGVKERLDRAVADKIAGEVVLYDGPVRYLCPLAPNNINTMAAAALAGHTLGLDGTRGVLISDDSLDEHIVEVDVLGPLPGACSSAGSDSGRLVPFALDAATAGEGSKPFRVISTRVNPAAAGVVTGSATYVAFVSSMLAAARWGGATGGMPGVHFC